MYHIRQFINAKQQVMNDTVNREESQLANIMAAVGLLVMICLLAWLAVQLVRFMPTVFSRLATVFEENQRQLEEETNDGSVVVVGEVESGDDESTATDEEEDPADEESEEEEIEEETPEDTEDANNTASEPKPTAPVEYKTVVTYKTPVSDPKGYSDLLTTFYAVGSMTSNGRFVQTNYLERDEESALQFKVKNIGTKTSTEWHFVAELPDGSTVTSRPQLPLKPSETATLTLVFDGVESRSDDTARISVAGGDDVNPSNNSFKVQIEIR